MESFSWSDTVKAAFSSCLPCFRSSSSTESNDIHIYTNDGSHRIARARPDELHGLLADVADTDTEAETHSLHSNPGNHHQHRRSRKSRRSNHGAPKRITFLGWNLFGRPPAIQLPPDDVDDPQGGDRRRMTGDDDDNDGAAPPRRNGNRRSRNRSGSSTISSSTLDADAAPLDPSTIDGLSPVQLHERALAAAAEEERRRKRRKERKELKRVGRALAMGSTEGESFEGFQGSGGAGEYPRMPSPFLKHPSQDTSGEAFGPFISGNGRRPNDLDADADDADLGGELYTRPSANGSHSGSDSYSSNNPSQQAYNHTTHLQPLSRHSLTPASDSLPRAKKKSRSSATSQTTSQSPSLPSPVLPAYIDPRIELVSPTSPQHDGLDTGFPSPGFGGVRSKNRDLGAFLARRGDA